MPKLIRRLSGVVGMVVALLFAFPVSASAAEMSDAGPVSAHATKMAADPTPADGYKTGNLTDAPAPEKKGQGTKAAWGYQITASCAGLEGPIRQGANFWEGATETPGSGTPVECTNTWVQGCGDATNVVGCNWGQGQRIMLSTLVSDFALLAAHEFGHNWYGHSAAGCANWASAYEVMRPTMC